MNDLIDLINAYNANVQGILAQAVAAQTAAANDLNAKVAAQLGTIQAALATLNANLAPAPVAPAPAAPAPAAEVVPAPAQ